MKNREIRKLASQNLKGKKLKGFLFSLLFIIVALLISSVPYVGVFAFCILLPSLYFGSVQQIIALSEGEKVGAFDFLSYDSNKFTKSLKVTLQLLLKILPSIILIIVCTTFQENIAPIIRNVIITAATVWILIIALKYLMLPYTMKYNIDKLEPKELIEKAYKDAEGHHWQYIRMNLNYFLKLLLVASYPLVYLYLSFNSSHNSVVSDCEGWGIILTMFLSIMLVFLLFIPTMVITSSYLNTKCIASCNEFYKAKVLKNQTKKEIAGEDNTETF